MVIHIFTKKESALKTVFPKNTQFSGGAVSGHVPEEGGITYLDVSGFDAAEIKTSLTRLKKVCRGTPWGIIDPKGMVKDPASLFFAGASDYLGPGFFKGAVESKRLKAASQWRAGVSVSGSAGGAVKGEAKNSGNAPGFAKTGIKVSSPAAFPGWKNLKAGKAMPFFLLYCAIEGKTALNTRLGEEAYGYLHQRLQAYLFQNFQEGDGLVWIDSGRDFLFLLPPKTKNAEAAVTACVRMLASAPLAAIETFGLRIPVNFIFALHYGTINYNPPGKTGTVVSDAVNFVFHLGHRKAETGRLTLSEGLPEGSVPKALEDCFVSAGEYEGLKIWHTKKFGYLKPWL